jgi:hypothetical protein
MIDKDIGSMKQLSLMSKVPYVTICTILNGNNTSLKSADKVLSSLGLKLCVIDKECDNERLHK